MRAIEPGTILSGKYRVERVLGEGGMGVVVLGTHLRMGQKVAIKLLRAGGRERADLVARFAREARAASTLRGEHSVRIFDVDDSEEGEPFIVMEYLEGRDLQASVTESGPLALVDAVELVLQACEGIAEAHALGIVHRDLKPANLFLTARLDGSKLVKILDFGISRAADAGDEHAAHGITRPDAALGSPSYMSPEQLKDASSASASADIWALGVVLYQLLTGELPFEATTTAALAARIAADPPKPLRALRPDVPEVLEAVILRCLEKDVANRFASAAALAQALAPFSPRGESGAMRTVRVGEEQARKRATPTPPPPLVSAHVSAAAGRGTPGATVSLHGGETGAPRAGLPRVVTEDGASVSSEPEAERKTALKWMIAVPAVLVVVMGIGAVVVATSTPRPPAPAPAPASPPSSATATATSTPTPTPTPTSTATATATSSASASGPGTGTGTGTGTFTGDAGRGRDLRGRPRKNPMEIEFR